MASEAERKRQQEKTTFWQKAKVAFTPGDVSDRSRELSSMADATEADERRKAELEAIRRKRMNAGE